jgi:hypothetical protein
LVVAVAGGFVYGVLNLDQLFARINDGGGFFEVLIILGWAGMAGLVALSLAYDSTFWLHRLPLVVGRVGPLLDRSEPRRMKLRVTKADESPGFDGYSAALRSPDPGGPRLEFKLEGLLPPYWLLSTSHQDEFVWVYGLDDSPPYIIEFDDGWLALVHPDSE